MKTRRVKAFVITGREIAATARASDISQILREHKVRLIDGSLNLISNHPLWLDPQAAFFSKERRYYWFATLNGSPVIVNRWGGCPGHVFEVFSADHLRTRFRLSDGDPVLLEFPVEILDATKNSSFRKLLKWYLVWSKRERLYYRSFYLRVLSMLSDLRARVFRRSL